MKGGLRLAQSLDQQRFENMWILRDFSSLPEADSTAPQKRDSPADSAPLLDRFRVSCGG
jgi:hypothetical protein